MFLTANVVGATLLFIECQLAWYAFSGLPNECEKPIEGIPQFPCKPDSNGFNQNFNGIPVVGQFVQFYPMLNTAAVPILMISLRNNLMQVLPIKSWLSRYDNACCRFLAQVSSFEFLIACFRINGTTWRAYGQWSWAFQRLLSYVWLKTHRLLSRILEASVAHLSCSFSQLHYFCMPRRRWRRRELSSMRKTLMLPISSISAGQW